jgi:hypothetical protein
MKSIVKGLLMGGLFFFLCYLLGSFNSTTFDISKWNESVRAGVSLMGGMFSIFIIIITFMVDRGKM